MITNSKKITSIFFVLLGLVPLLFILLIAIKKHDIRQRMKKELEQKHLQTIILPENRVTWMDDHEIWVNNSMFDIHTQKLENGIYTFTGLYDEEETRLVEKAKNAAGKNNEQNKLLAQLFKSLPVFCEESSDSFSFYSLRISHHYFLVFYPVHQYKEIPTPPPQVYC